MFAQKAKISGIVKGTDDDPIPGVSIVVKENVNQYTQTNAAGYYELEVDAEKPINVIFSNISFTAKSIAFHLKSGEVKMFNTVMSFKNTLKAVEIIDQKTRAEEITSLNTKWFNQLPTTTGNIEDLIKTQIGVSSNNELSSGYSVRGGNYDENLIYVNDIEVYRPFLARSGQQEGLSFANPNMVQNMNFSSGGFETKYGDKMSSVLDITYRKPLKFGGNASASILGGNIQLEGISKNRLVSWNIGARYRTNQYLLNTLDTKGEYRPSSADIQSFLTFDINPKWKVEWLSSFANNRYLVIPSNRETNFGTVNQALRLTIYFDGQDLMQYNTLLTGISTTYKPNNQLKLKFITSAYNTNEEELYTVQGQYYIDQLEADLGKPNFGQVAFNRGIGTFLNNGRNYLNANVYNAEHKGTYYFKNKTEFLWGLRHQIEQINDRLGEWRMIDSAGYVIPYSPTDITLTDVYKTNISLFSQRTMAYSQYNFNYRFKDSSELFVNAGVRANYWTLNKQLVVSPRITLSYKPNWKYDWMFKFSTGYYYQPPFYRELRNIDGTVNTSVKAQLAVHYVLTADNNFTMWGRKFKFITAAYFKDLRNLNPYEIDNVRIRYFANNNSIGYATGMDFRVNGEFVKGIDSWMNLGLLRTYEYSPNNIHYNYYNKEGEKIVRGYTFDQVKADSQRVDPGYIPRPTDQLVTFSMFFQDYLPRLPQFKFNLNLQFGSGLPFGPPTHIRWQQILRMPPYRRVDAGFAYNILKENREIKRKNFLNHLKDMWIFVEVFNLLDVQNTVSYTWVHDVTGNMYAVPNYLTSRQINLRLQVKF
ncbi:MAG: TonB-dependent receptor [Bacteroidetes bacterium]|nr:TonB-dependent receptor [Bacteroidota bacterium]